MKPGVISILLLTAYALLIAWLSLSTAEPGPPVWFEQEDKLFHLLAYAVFVVFATPLLQSLRFVVTILLGIWGFSGLMEIIQYWIPGREASWLDMLANSFGVFVGFILVKGYFQKKLQ